MKFYPIWSKDCGEMTLDRRTEGWTEGRTDEAVTRCSLFGKHDKHYNYCQKKKYRYSISKIVIFARNPAPFFSMTERQIEKTNR